MSNALSENEIQCAWCETVNRDLSLTNCNNCGGPLPPPPGQDPGPEPPPAPRVLPAGYHNRIMYWKNVEVMIGILFTVVFFWTILFLIVGILLWYYGRKRAVGKLMALENGRATRAEISDIYIDHSTKDNGRSPWVIEYLFQTPGGERAGKAVAWNPINGSRRVGEPLWVVFVPEDPEKNAIWPPIK